MFPLRFSAKDARRAHETKGCNCGPGALAALAGVSLEEAIALLPGFERNGRATKPEMLRAALDKLSIQYTEIDGWPNCGFVLLGWLGPCEDGTGGYHNVAHWIAVSGNSIFDFNAALWGRGRKRWYGREDQFWCSREEWDREIRPAVMVGMYGDWRIVCGIEIRG